MSAKLLICEKGLSLHTAHYIKAFKKLSDVSFLEIPSTLSRKEGYLFAISHAKDNGIKAIIFLSFEKFIGIYLLNPRMRNRCAGILVFSLYFNLHNLAFAGLKQLLFSLYLACSPLTSIIISDKNFINYPFYWLVKRKLFYAPDFWDESIATVPSKTQCISEVAKYFDFDPSEHNYIMSVCGGIDGRKAVDKLLFAIDRNRKAFVNAKILVIISGVFERAFLQNFKFLLEDLQNINVLRYSDEHMAVSLMHSVIRASNFSWCVRHRFYGSSGIFTSSMALGSIPIVTRDSPLYSICLDHGLGIFLENDQFYLVSERQNPKVTDSAYNDSRLDFSQSLCEALQCQSLSVLSRGPQAATRFLESCSTAEFLNCIMQLLKAHS